MARTGSKSGDRGMIFRGWPTRAVYAFLIILGGYATAVIGVVTTKAQAPVIGQGGAAPNFPLINRLFHIHVSGPPPVISGCGTNPVLVNGSTDTAGSVAPGANATACVITFANPFGLNVNQAPFCSVDGSSVTVAYSTSPTAINVLSTSGSSPITWQCFGNLN